MHSRSLRLIRWAVGDWTLEGLAPGAWREASAPYGEDGSFRSVADIVSPESLTKVREHKRAMKAAAKG